MLTPEYLNLLEFNDVVKMYNELNIEITADIIDRVSRMQEITSTSKEQMKILLQINGTEVFEKALEKTSMLTNSTKSILKQIFTDMAKEDTNGYKYLYEYRGKPFKLSDEQYRILNQGLKQTNRTLKNLTNSIAFQSKQSYIEAVDEAYRKVISGAFSYTSAINTAVNKLAEKGIVLKDKAGRNVQLEVAVRRNILSGIRETSNNLERDVEEELGCNGYEVTAHTGARPGHAEAQGKQYAISKEDSEKYHIGLWQDVEDLWEEYNCRHSYFGIILGISEPQYTNNELNKMKNAKIMLNNKEIPYYEATQKQRQLENNIRKAKRTVQILEKAGINNEIEKIKLTQVQKEYRDFCKETGLQKEYNRIRISKNNSTKLVKNDIIILPNYKNAIVPIEKFTKYALDLNNPKGKNKAIAFEEALGYNLTNVDKLIKNIQNNINNFNAIEKEDKGFGKRYEVLMTLIGENKKIANVKTGWIVDNETGETRLTSAYVTQKGRKKKYDDKDV